MKTESRNPASEASWLVYKHGVLNPMSRLSKAIRDNLEDIETLCEHGPFVQTITGGGVIEITYTRDEDDGKGENT